MDTLKSPDADPSLALDTKTHKPSDTMTNQPVKPPWQHTTINTWREAVVQRRASWSLDVAPPTHGCHQNAQQQDPYIKAYMDLKMAMFRRRVKPMA